MAGALFIGDLANGEFTPALAALREAFDVATYCEPREAVASLASESAANQDSARSYELVVLAQSRPGEITPADLDALRRQLPLAPVVALAGSWCEGETRSGKPLAAACRLYWHQAATRLRQDIARRTAGRAPTWSLPSTSSEDERVLARSVGPRRPAPVSLHQRYTVALFGQERTAIEFLVDACRAGGFEPLWIGPGRTIEPARVQAGIWDVTAFSDATTAELTKIRQLLPADRVVALIGFPRWHDIERAARLGLGAVVSKPFTLADLFDAIEHVAAPRLERNEV